MKDLMIILGSPASGKTTLARRLTGELSVPCLCKDDFKEALFDVLGVAGREDSRRLSDASFAAQLRVGHRQLDAGLSCMLEGNWRVEHSVRVRSILSATGARCAQIGCRADPREIERRFTGRVRHPGHLDDAVPDDEVKRACEQPPTFMDLPGPRWVYDSDQEGSYERLLRDLKVWRL